MLTDHVACAPLYSPDTDWQISLIKCGKIISYDFNLHLVSLSMAVSHPMCLCTCHMRDSRHMCLGAHVFVCLCLCDSESFPHPSLKGLFHICVTYVFMSDCSGFGVYICVFMCLFLHVCVCVRESMYSKTCGFAL